VSYLKVYEHERVIVTNHPIKFEKTFKIHRNITLKGGSYLAPPML